MYDPLLHLTVHKLIQELFRHLIKEISNLGTSVVFANSNKIILSTTSSSLEDANEYCEFLIKSIRSSPSFSYLQLDPTRYWRVLLFKDSYNFGGVAVTDFNDETRILSNWHILELLPTEVSNYGLATLAQLIHDSYNFICTVPDCYSLHERVVEFINNSLIKDTFSPKLLDSVQLMQKLENQEFPVKLGVKFTTNYPGLEFVKILMHLLGLEQGLSDEVHKLRKNLLRLLGYSDFSNDAQFVEPCAGLVLPEVICKNCVYTRDIDLCKDPNVSQGQWICSICQAPLSKQEFELRLLATLQNNIKYYQNQDLRCRKCRLNKGFLLSKTCSCSGTYVPTKDAGAFTQFLETTKEIAEYHEFKYLSSLMSSLIT